MRSASPVARLTAGVLVAAALLAIAAAYLSPPQATDRAPLPSRERAALPAAPAAARPTTPANVPHTAPVPAVVKPTPRQRDLGADPWWNIVIGPPSPDTRFFARIDAARAGDRDAMVDVARVLASCWWPMSFRDEADVRATLARSGNTEKSLERETISRMRACNAIANASQTDFPDVPRRYLASHAQRAWLERAVARGSRVARLEMLVDVPADAAEIAQLLDALVDTRDPHVLRRASQFVSVRSTDADARETAKWAYLACTSAPECDAERYRDTMLAGYPEGVQMEIVAFAEQYDGREALGISFVEIERTRPYSVYSDEVLALMDRLVRTTRSARSIAPDAAAAALDATEAAPE